MLKILFQIIFFPMRMIAYLIPKNDKVWLFGSWKGLKYSDNSRALFEYVNAQRKDIRPIWISKSPSVIAAVRAKGYEAYLTNSWQGIYFGLISSVLVTCVGFTDLNIASFIFPWRKKIIQLWHGTPLKKLDNFTIFPFLKRLATHMVFAYIGRWFEFIASAAEGNKQIYTHVFDISQEKVRVTGQPRNDQLFDFSHQDGRRKIIYLPTWREYDPNYDLFFRHGFDAVAMNEVLETLNAELIIKFHVNESTKQALSAKTGDRIKFTNIEDVHEILGQMDVLLTDYSSIYFDFLLLDRPIVFTPFDLTTYQQKRGMYYKYEEVTPGIIAHDWKQVCEALTKCLNEDEHGLARNKIATQFNHWMDGKSSERVFNEIIRYVE